MKRKYTVFEHVAHRHADIEGGGILYLPPEISVIEIGIESGFANSISITSPDDELPQIDGIDNWEDWE